VRSTDSLVKIGKWSDRQQWVTEMEQARSQKRLLLGRECDSGLVVSWEIYMLS